MGEFTPEMQEKLDAMFPLYEKPEAPSYRIEEQFRGLAANLLMDQAGAKTAHAKRSLSLALTEIETACMYAVKAVHQG